MRSWGIWLIILGILAFIYPLFGYQLKILSFLDDAGYTIAAIILIIAGIVLTVLPVFLNRKTSSAPEKSNESANDTTKHGQSGSDSVSGFGS